MAALWCPEAAHANTHMPKLFRAVQRSDAVVKARIVAMGRAKSRRTATLRVLEPIIGTCGERVGVIAWWPKRELLGYEADRVGYFCLRRSAKHPGFYHDILGPSGDSKEPMLVKGDRVDLSGVGIPPAVSTYLEPCTPGAVETVLRWLRGPKLTARPTEASFRFDEPLTFEVTVTNSTRLPMALPAAGDRFGECFGVGLADAHGANLLGRGPCLVSQDVPPVQPIRVLAPGGAFTARVTVRAVPIDRYAQDPRRARTAVLSLSTPYPSRDVREGLWGGVATAEAPIRLTCPFRRWAADLPRPNARWAVWIGTRGSWNWQRVVAGPRQAIPLFVGLRAPELASPHRIDRLPLPLARALASCMRIEHGGRPLAGPAPDTERVLTWLAGLSRGVQHLCQFDLARHRSFERPGLYRLGLVLPGKREPSLSNVLELLVLEAAGAP